jgi:hypothetical protein
MVSDLSFFAGNTLRQTDRSFLTFQVSLEFVVTLVPAFRAAHCEPDGQKEDGEWYGQQCRNYW